jgi:pantoate kinase
MPKLKSSRSVYAPCAVSSFFEICDTKEDGTRVEDPLKVGSRGGGFVIEKGNTTTAFTSNSLRQDTVKINGKSTPQARTTLKVVELLRKEFRIPYVQIVHKILPPIGSGFGTSGAGAVGAVISLSDLFDLHLTLSEASSFAHRAEVESVTGLGTVISIISGSGAMGLVTEPGSYSIGRVDALLSDYNDYTLVCASFGPIEKSTVLQSAALRSKVNEYGREAMRKVLKDRTPESLLRSSRSFAELTGIATPRLLKISDKAIEFGAVGSTQNMIGNAIHCLVEKKRRKKFLDSFLKLIPRESLFESELCHSGPTFLE